MACGNCGGGIVHGALGLAKAGAQMIGLPVDRVSNQVLLMRRDKCRECPHATRSAAPKYAVNKGLTSLSRCGLCKWKCLIAAKTMLASERCPDNPPRW